MIYESKYFPAALREEIYQYIKSKMISEKKDTDTEEQFIYKTRKKGFGPFKKDLWNLPERRAPCHRASWKGSSPSCLKS